MENMQWDDPRIVTAIGVSVGAGLATGIGGSLVFFPEMLKKIPQATILACSLALSSGVMLYVSFIEIFAKSYAAIAEADGWTEGAAAATTTACFFSGMLICVLLEVLVHYISKTNPGVEAHPGCPCDDNNLPIGIAKESATASITEDAPACCEDDGCERDNCADDAERPAGEAESGAPSQVQIQIVNDTAGWDSAVTGKKAAKKTAAKNAAKAVTTTKSGVKMDDQDGSLSRMGMMTALAIAIHNFPEGLATFMATVEDERLGLSLGVAIAIHNIPEGLCVAMPIYYSTGNKWKAFLWSVASGLTEPIGGILGFAALQPVFTPTVFGIVFAMVGGMMVFIVCHELLPAAHRYMGSQWKATAWLVLGMFIMALSLVLFNL